LLAKPVLILRIHNYNKVSFGAILGCLDESLLSSFDIIAFEGFKDFDLPSWQGRRILALYSFMQSHMPQVYKEILEFKENYPQAEFLAGGAQATAAPETIETLGFDYVCSGEGENFIGAFLLKWLEGKADRGIHRTGKAQVDLNASPGFSRIIDYLPPIEISRGCSFGCMFCGVPALFAGKVRHRSVDSICSIAEEYLRINPSRRVIKFLAPNAFAYGSHDGKPNLQAIKELLEGLTDTGIKSIQMGSFPAEVRPDFVTREVMELVSKYAKNKTIVMGLQTGSDAMLKKMNRRHTVEDSLRAVALIREFGYTPHLDFIVGNPGETYKDQLEMLEFIWFLIKTYGAKIHMHAFTPLPHTAWAKEEQSEIFDDIKAEMKRMQSEGHLDGWWENHIGYYREGKNLAKSLSKKAKKRLSDDKNNDI